MLFRSAGFESVWFPEHSHLPTASGGWPGGDRIPASYARTIDQWVALGMAIEATSTITLGTGMTLVPQHDPIWLAKQAASVDHLSGGRLVMGVGYTWNRAELADHGVEIERMTKGFASRHCNLVCSLDGQIDRRDKPMLITDWRGKTWELEGLINWETKFPIHPPKDPEAFHYMLQCQGGMDCAETRHCILAYLPRSTMEWIIVVYEWNSEVCKAIGDAVDDFWQHMENDTYYDAQTTTEANKLIRGNGLPDPVDLRQGPNDLYTESELETLVQATTDYLTAKRTKKIAEQSIEDAQLVIQHFMGGVEKLKLDGADINWTTVENKAKPEKATITLGNLPLELEETIRGCADKVSKKEPSKMTRRFSVKEIAHV